MQGKFRIKALVVTGLVFLLSFALLGLALFKVDDTEGSWTDTARAVWAPLLAYAEGPIPAFDHIVRTDRPLEYGENTFIGALNIIRRWQGYSAVSPIQDEVYVPFPVNVYTALQPVYVDFGAVGVVLAFAIVGSVSTFFYIRALAGDGLYILLYVLALFPLLY